MKGVRICLLGVAATVAIGLGGSPESAGGGVQASEASSYPWPVAPFDQPHPVRAVVGDPRTIFRGNGQRDPLAGPGTFSFHNGIDIDAPNGTAVYPVVSGIARWITTDGGVLVQAVDGRMFMYRHIVPAVPQWDSVTAGETVLGHVRNWAEELHFSEFAADGNIVNPLLPGHLSPYADGTAPTVSRLHFRDVRGRSLPSFDLHGPITIIADASDTPMPVASARRSGFTLSKFALDRFPVAPAVVTWSLAVVGGRIVVPPSPVVDFRDLMLPGGSLWSVYARGTYQNRSVIGRRMHALMPGRFLFTLTRSPLDTRRLANGVYVVTATAIDVAGNRGTFSERVEVWNPSNARRS